MKRASFFPSIVILMLVLLQNPAQAGYQTYDDFSGTLDSTRWYQPTGLAESVRQVDTAQGNLVLGFSGTGDDNGDNGVTVDFRNPETITAIQATADITALTGISDANVDIMGVQLIGAFYQSGVIDVVASVGIYDRGSGLQAEWEVRAVTATSDIQNGSGVLIAPGTLNVGTFYDIYVSYNQGTNEFTFTVNGVPFTYQPIGLPYSPGVPANPFKQLAVTRSGASFQGQCAMTARFDNVEVNGASYDTFTNALLDNALWTDHEAAREISAGKLQTYTSGADTGTEYGIGLKNETTSYLEAKIAMAGATQVSGASGVMRIMSTVYNDTYGPGSGLNYNQYLGNVVATCGLWLDAANQLVARGTVMRCRTADLHPTPTTFDINSFAILYQYNFPVNVALDQEYTFSIQYTGDTIVLGCNTYRTTYTIQTPTYPPYAGGGYLNAVGSVLWAATGESGRVYGTFDDVRVFNSPPGPVSAISPLQETTIAGTNLQLETSIYDDADGDPHIQTYWRVRRADRVYGCADYDPSFTAVATSDLTRHMVFNLEPGMKYVWQAGYEDGASGEITWSNEYTFKVGTPEADTNVGVPPGNRTADFRMVSFTQWPDDPDAMEVLRDEVGAAYNSRDFKIGTYDPENGLGEYVEYGNTLEIVPGRSYWCIARNGMTITVDGIPVSLANDMEVALKYNADADNGWNMIGCPNPADYSWANMEIVVYDPNGNILFGPTPISALADTNPYIDTHLWRWSGGSYYSDTLFLYQNEGYWVRVRQSDVYLRFPVSAQYAGGTIQRGWLRARQAARRWFKGIVEEVGPAAVMADTQESPPLPMADLTESVGAESGGTGCFISTVLSFQ